MMQSIRPRVTTFALALAVPFAFACAPDRDDDAGVPGEMPPPAAAEADVPPELEAATDSYVAAWNGTDAQAVAAYFTEGAMATVDGEMFHGRDEVRTGWIEPNVGNVSNLQVTSTATRREGTDYHSEGTYSGTFVTPEGETVDATGRYTVVWTRDADGEWRISSTTVQADEPPQG